MIYESFSLYFLAGIRVAKMSGNPIHFSNSMRIILYILGSLIVLGGACYAAMLLGVPTVWIGVIAAVILGLGIMGAANVGGSSSGPSKDGPSTVINKVE